MQFQNLVPAPCTVAHFTLLNREQDYGQNFKQEALSLSLTSK